MKAMAFSFALALSLAIAPATAALAQDPGEFYIGIHGGASFLADADNTDQGGFVSENDFETGIQFGGVIGYRVFRNLRVEGEVTFRDNNVDSLRFAGGSEVDAGGGVMALSGLVNVWYDIPIPARVTPYIGGGVGLATVEPDDVSAGGVLFADDNADLVFGGQAGAGLRIPLLPRITASLDYRYFRTVDPELRDVTGAAFEAEYETHNLGATVSFAF